MPDTHARLRTLASTQDGQFATRQATSLGLSYSSVGWLRDRGETVSLRRGVWRFRATAGEPDPAATAFLACWPDGVISHGSAAAYHGLASRPPALPEVTVPPSSRPRSAGVRVHTSRSLSSGDILKVGGLRYTSIARTVCDLADSRDPWGSLARLDDAVSQGASPRWIHSRAIDLANGRDGLALIRSATDRDGAEVFRSWLERAAAELYRAASIPEPAWNVAVRDEKGLIGIVDSLWAPWRVISEKEGLRFHTSPAQRRKDAARFNRLDESGYTTRRFTWEDVVHRPVDVAASVLRALRQGGCPVDLDRLPHRIVLPPPPGL